MKNVLFAALGVLVLGCGSVVIDDTSDSSPGDDDTTWATSSGAITGSSSGSTVSSSTSSGVTSSVSSSSVGSGGASASSSSSVTVGGGSSVASSSSMGGGTSVSSSGSGGSAQAPQISVILAPDTPPGMNIPVDAEDRAVLKLNFLATPVATKITKLCVMDTGPGAFTDIQDATLYNPQFGYVSAEFDAQTRRLCFDLDHIVSTEESLGYVDYATLIIDFDAPYPGGVHQFMIWNSYDVWVSGVADDSWPGRVSGQFPIAGNAFTITQGTTDLEMGLTIEEYAQPMSTIVVGGKNEWIPFAQYKATSTYEDCRIDYLRVRQTSPFAADNSDCEAIAVASNGVILGTDLLPSGTSGEKDVYLEQGITVPLGSPTLFQVWCKPAAVVSSSAAPSGGVPRSGHAPALGIADSVRTGEWDDSYDGRLNVRAMGLSSLQRVVAMAGATMGNPMVLRKSQPIVTKQALPSATLANIDLDLFKFQIAADDAGSIALKQIVFWYSKTSALWLYNFRLRRGATDLSAGIYAVTADDGTDLLTGSLAPGSNVGKIVISMAPGQEESISGSGNVYTLHATVSGAASGQNVTLSFYRGPAKQIITGYLASNVADTTAGLTANSNVFVIDTANAPSGAFGATGSFLWSDNSEAPHSPAVGASRDWTDDVYVQDIAQSQTLAL